MIIRALVGRNIRIGLFPDAVELFVHLHEIWFRPGLGLRAQGLGLRIEG